jgi:acyl CoA:acetate/3-ketoacid CoA transferase
VTAGVGGFVDITARARNLVFSGCFTAGGLELDFGDGELRIVKEGRAQIRADVEHVTFSGQRALAGQQVIYITERRAAAGGGWADRGQVAPGVDLERDVLGQADIRCVSTRVCG